MCVTIDMLIHLLAHSLHMKNVYRYILVILLGLVSSSYIFAYTSTPMLDQQLDQAVVRIEEMIQSR